MGGSESTQRYFIYANTAGQLYYTEVEKRISVFGQGQVMNFIMVKDNVTVDIINSDYQTADYICWS